MSTTIATACQHGLIFSDPMVRALLAGRKTRTMRLIKNLPAHWVRGKKPLQWGEADFCFFEQADPIGTYPSRVTSPIQIGDLLYVKEAYAQRVDVDWRTEPEKALHYVMYRADEAGDPRDENNWHNYGGRWRSARTMPKVYARIWLRVTKRDVQRPRDLSPWDCVAEGVEWNRGPTRDGHTNPISAFAHLWHTIHGPDAWERNDWCFVYHFERTEKPE